MSVHREILADSLGNFWYKPLVKRANKPTTPELPILSLDQAVWEKWLAKNHATSRGVWLRIQKKVPGKSFLTYAEALDVALCYGWIDGQRKPFDEKSWLQKFTQRRPKSGWSKKNTEHAKRLIQSGKMKKSGLAQIDAAKKDGRWKTAYDPQSTAEIPEDFLKALKKNKQAFEFFQTLNKTNLYSISYRLQTAKKQETRVKRMHAILEMMKKKKKFH
jgi:uncharacterized protein YdeI (YjbR/CyaY-like superfamily)